MCVTTLGANWIFHWLHIGEADSKGPIASPVAPGYVTSGLISILNPMTMTKKQLKILAVITLVFLFIPDKTNATTSVNDWELRLHKKGIKVYIRHNRHKGLIEFKTQTVLKTTLSQITQIFDDVKSYPEWMANIKQINTINATSPTGRYDYFEVSFPWPFENRDMVLKIKSYYPDTGAFHIDLLNYKSIVDALHNGKINQKIENFMQKDFQWLNNEDYLSDKFLLINEEKQPLFPVRKQDKLAGVVSQESIHKWIQTKPYAFNQ